MSEKTEQPTAKKLRDARKKGQVATSKEVVSAAIMIAVYAYFFSYGDRYYEQLQEMIVAAPNFYDMPFGDALNGIFGVVRKVSIGLLLPIVGIVIIVAIMANFFQVGALLAVESIKPDLKKLNPAQGMKKIFAIKNVVEALKSIVKIVFLSALLYVVIKNAFASLVNLPYCAIDCVPAMINELMLKVAIYSATAFVIVAAADYTFQRFQHIKQLKMTKDEVKREYKEMEGDPLIKSKRRQLHQEMITSGMVASVKKSSVVVTNPTRIAVALEYAQGETPLPVVRAKGEGIVARRIIEIAQAEGIPIMENLPLAQALHERVDIDHYIPSDLLEAVAEVLRLIRQLDEG